jgi:hypothetical protein
MSTKTDRRIIVRHDFPEDWGSFLRSVLDLVTTTLIKDERRRPHSNGTLVPLGFVAILHLLGHGHLLARDKDRLKAAVARISPPGPKPTGDSQIDLLDTLTLPDDPTPGAYVSLSRLVVGNVIVMCGMYELSLQGCHTPTTAVPKAIAEGWGVLPERRGNADGLRFLPPSVCAEWFRREARPTPTAPHPEHYPSCDGMVNDYGCPPVPTCDDAGNSTPPEPRAVGDVLPHDIDSDNAPEREDTEEATSPARRPHAPPKPAPKKVWRKSNKSTRGRKA